MTYFQCTVNIHDTYESSTSLCTVVVQGVIQDFEVEGGNDKSNQKMMLKKGQLLFSIPGHSVIIERGGIGAREGISPLPPCMTPCSVHKLLIEMCALK